jgi:hypothetical protein
VATVKKSEPAQKAAVPGGITVFLEDDGPEMTVSILGLRAFRPADEIEGMLAAQAMAQHHAAMECSRLAMVVGQPFEFAQASRKAAANASRTFSELLTALDRRRGKAGQQVVRVEHVHIHPGAQGIVGNIGTSGGRGGGGARDMREEPQVPDQLAHTPIVGQSLSAVRGADAERELVPATGDAEPSPLSTSRRRQHRA